MSDASGGGRGAWGLVLAGLLTALIGLGILLVQTIRLLEPDIGLSLIGLALGFGGALVGVIGVVREASLAGLALLDCGEGGHVEQGADSGTWGDDVDWLGGAEKDGSDDGALAEDL